MSNINIDAGLAGIYNMGNTCFLNTAIQCLSAVQPLTDYFLGDLHKIQLNTTNPMGSGGKVTSKFAKLIKTMWSGKEEKIYPVKLLKILGEHASHLICGQQQDNQEFLAYLLDCLHEDLNRADKLTNLQKQREIDSLEKLAKTNKDDEDDMIYEELSDEQQELIAYEAWKDHLHNNRSIIVDLFQGQLKSTLKCMRCEYMSIKFDSFMFLSLPIPHDRYGNTSLEDCVEEFTREEILDEENKWKCPKCKSFQKATKKIDIWKLPSVLIIHLKRFEFSQKKRGKIKKLIDFPLKNLNLTPYVSRLQREKPIYDLFAVANHEGYLGGGHYYSFTKHRNNQQWNYFNDDVVHKMKREEKVITPDAYILFYSKMTVDEFCRQTLTEPGLWPHIINQKKEQTKFPLLQQPQNLSIIKAETFKTPQQSSQNRKISNNLIKVASNFIHPQTNSQSNILGMDSIDTASTPGYQKKMSFRSQMVDRSEPFQSKYNSRYNQEANASYIEKSENRLSKPYTSSSRVVGELIANNGQQKPMVINNNSNNYFINLYMRNDNKY